MGGSFPQGTLPIKPVLKEGLLFNVTDCANNYSCFIHTLPGLMCLALPTLLICFLHFVLQDRCESLGAGTESLLDSELSARLTFWTLSPPVSGTTLKAVENLGGGVCPVEITSGGLLKAVAWACFQSLSAY